MNRNSSKSKKQGRKACKPVAPENSSLPPEARERIPDNYVRMWLGR